MNMLRLDRQPDLFAAQDDLPKTSAALPAWKKHPGESTRITADLEAIVAYLRKSAAFPYRDASEAMSAEIRFNDLAEIWLPPEMGHPLQVAFAQEMVRLGESVDYPIYDWIGRHRPPPCSPGK